VCPACLINYGKWFFVEKRTKSFSKMLLLSREASGQNQEEGRPSQTLMRSPEQVYSQPSHRCTFVTRTIIIHTSHRLRTAQTPFPPSMAGLTPSFGCRHPRGTRDRWRHYHGHGVKLWLPARLYRATIHSALRAEFQQPRKAGTRCDGARSRATADSPMLRYRPN